MIIRLSSIVKQLSARIGIEESRLDVSELTDEVTGFVVGGLYSAAEALRSLQRTYFFDPVEVDGTIRFVKRGKGAVATIDESEMVDTPEETTREQEVEFPKKIHLSYQNADIGYAPTQANFVRSSPDLRVTTEMSVEVPVVLSADQAAQVVDIMGKVSWIDAMGEVKFRLPDNYAWITPTDCLNLTYRGRNVRVRVERIENADGEMMITSRFDRISAYASTATGLQPLPTLPPVSTAVGETYFEVMNIPALVDLDDRLGYYTIAAGEKGGWSGGVTQRSIDGGANYSEVDTFGTGALMGELTATLPNASAYVTDTTNVLQIQLYGPADGALESANLTQFLQDANAALVGDEIIQFKDAVEVTEGIWELTTLARGRLATTPASHAIGTRFCLLEGAHFIECSSSLIGQTLTHRAVAYTTDATLAPTDTQAFTPARSQQEWAPIGLTLTKAGDILTATWIPRHRFGTAANPVASANFQGYRVTIVGSSTITVDTTGSSITQDITGLGTVTVTVAGINRITGVSTLTATGTI